MSYWVIGLVLTLTSANPLTGKPVGQDLRRKKKTLPVLLLASAANQDGRDHLQAFFAESDPSSESVAALLAMMRELGIRSKAQALVDEYSNQALEALTKLPDGSSTRTEFAALIDFFATRDG